MKARQYDKKKPSHIMAAIKKIILTTTRVKSSFNMPDIYLMIVVSLLVKVIIFGGHDTP